MAEPKTGFLFKGEILEQLQPLITDSGMSGEILDLLIANGSRNFAGIEAHLKNILDKSIKTKVFGIKAEDVEGGGVRINGFGPFKRERKPPVGPKTLRDYPIDKVRFHYQKEGPEGIYLYFYSPELKRPNYPVTQVLIGDPVFIPSETTLITAGKKGGALVIKPPNAVAIYQKPGVPATRGPQAVVPYKPGAIAPTGPRGVVPVKKPVIGWPLIREPPQPEIVVPPEQQTTVIVSSSEPTGWTLKGPGEIYGLEPMPPGNTFKMYAPVNEGEYILDNVPAIDRVKPEISWTRSDGDSGNGNKASVKQGQLLKFNIDYKRNYDRIQVIEEGTRKPLEGVIVRVFMNIPGQNVLQTESRELLYEEMGERDSARLRDKIRLQMSRISRYQYAEGTTDAYGVFKIPDKSRTTAQFANTSREGYEVSLRNNQVYDMLIVAIDGSYRYDARFIKFRKDANNTAPPFILGRGLSVGRVPEFVRKNIIGPESTYKRARGATPAWGKATYEAGLLKGRKVGTGESKAAEAMLPAVRAAINAGRSDLGRKARVYYNKEIKFLTARNEEARKKMNEARTALEKEMRALDDDINRMANFHGSDKVNFTKKLVGAEKGANIQEIMAAALGEAMKAASSGAAYLTDKERVDVQLIRSREVKIDLYLENFRKAREDVDKLKELPEKFDEKLKEHLEKEIPGVASKMAYAYRVKFAQADIEAALKEEAEYLGDFWSRHFRLISTRLFGRIGVALRAVSHRALGIGDLWHSLTANIWTFLTSPLVLGPLVIIAQIFVFSAWFIDFPGYNFTPAIPLILAFIGALAVLLINFALIKNPMDIIGHIAAGAVMALGIFMLLTALGLQGVMSMTIFWILFAGLLFVGTFQFYPAGGFQMIAVLAVFVIVFGYFAMGPYNQQIRSLRDQIITPLEGVFYQARNALEGVWLMVTNPTEYMARQQLQAARPERQISYPAALEFDSMYAVPSSVPSGEEITVYVSVSNKGDMTATNVTATADCALGDYKCSPLAKPPEVPVKDTIKKLDGSTFYFTLTSKGKEASKAGEVAINRVRVNVSYDYATNSSLQVEVASQDEMFRRNLRKEPTASYNEVARAKVGPAQLSLSVGPQPVEGGRKWRLAASISNTRPDGEVVLKQGYKLKISIAEIGDGLDCGGGSEIVSCTGGDCTVTRDWHIRSYEFADIVPVYCTFNARSLLPTQTSVTGLVNAELPRYTFVLSRTVDVSVVSTQITPISGPSGEVTACDNLNSRVRSYFSAFPGVSTAKDLYDKKANEIATSVRDNNLITKAGDETTAGAMVASILWTPPITTATGSDSDESVVWSQSRDSGRTLTAAIIDTYLKSNAQGTLRNQAQVFYDMGVKYDIDPAFAVAVAMVESGKGTSSAAINSNNYFGIMQNGATRSFATPQENIEYFYNMIKTDYVERNTHSQDTPRKIVCFDSGIYDGSLGHCYCTREPNMPEGTGCPNWLQNVPEYRSAVRGSLTLTQPQQDYRKAIKDSCKDSVDCIVKNLVALSSDRFNSIKADQATTLWANCLKISAQSPISTGKGVRLASCEYIGYYNGAWTKVAERTASPKALNPQYVAIPNDIRTYGVSGPKLESNTLECVKKLNQMSGGKLLITSAYRNDATSRHGTGQAIDFQIDGMSFEDAAILTQQTGCFTWVYNENKRAGGTNCPGSTGPHIHASVGANVNIDVNDIENLQD